MNTKQREEVLKERILHGRPEHSVPHVTSNTTTYYLVTAACFEHQPVIGLSPSRMAKFEDNLVESLSSRCKQVFAWNVLPNHYHVLVDTLNVKALLKAIGQLHGRSSFAWNGEEHKRGRQVWCNAAETAMNRKGISTHPGTTYCTMQFITDM